MSKFRRIFRVVVLVLYRITRLFNKHYDNEDVDEVKPKKRRKRKKSED